MTETTTNEASKKALAGSQPASMAAARVSVYKDFIDAQAEMKNAVMKGFNPHFKSKYADLTAVREATLPALKKYNLGIIQVPTMVGERFVLVSRLIHASGEVLQDSRYPLPIDGKPQEIGSAITYARRYTWAALCGISSDEDDDANVAQKAAEKQSDAQKVANKLSKSLRGCSTEDEIVALWEDSQDILDDIKKKSTIAYDALQKVYNTQLERLRPLPEDDVDDIGRDIPE